MNMGNSYAKARKDYVNTGRRYVVIKESNNGTFVVGDHIRFNEDGSISCLEAQGWVDTCDVAEATAGMLVKIDKKWIRLKKRKLLKELKSYE